MSKKPNAPDELPDNDPSLTLSDSSAGSLGDATEIDVVSSGVQAASAIRDAGQYAADQAKNLGGRAKSAAGEIADQAKEKAASAADQIKQQASAAAEQQKAGLADKLDDLAEVAHRSGEQLEGHQDWAAGLIEQGAQQLGSFATTLRQNDLGGLLSSLQNLARQQPALFTAASVAAGFALVRFGKIAVSGMSSDDLPTVPKTPTGPEAPRPAQAESTQ